MASYDVVFSFDTTGSMSQAKIDLLKIVFIKWKN